MRAIRRLTNLPLFLGFLVLAAVIVPAAKADDGSKRSYDEVVKTLEPWIAGEVTQKGLPAVSIALVDDQAIVWAKGFGYANPAKTIPATADTPYRVGSISKLFTDLALMKLVEAGTIDLDAPVAKILPEFKPVNSFTEPITLRQLVSHRAGLVREPPIGHYFDPVPRTLADVVASLNGTAIVYPPGSRTKYSNAGIAVVGRAFEVAVGEPFSGSLKRTILEPLGMSRSSFEPGPELAAELAIGTMWSYDDRPIENPTFLLGTGPAGNLVSTVNDLAKFVEALFADGKGVVKPETLRKMTAPQFVKPGEPGFGIGFALGNLEGKTTIGHGGAVYGFASELIAMPEEKLGAIVIASRDCANGIARRIAVNALRMMVAVKEKKPLPTVSVSSSVSDQQIQAIEGVYRKEEKRLDVFEFEKKLYVNPAVGGRRLEARNHGGRLVIDDRLASGPPILLDDQILTFGPDSFARVKNPEPPKSIPDAWKGLIGEYGWDHDVLYILEKEGKLHALIEWFFEYPLVEEKPGHFRFPNWGLYDGESILFKRDANGRATEANAANVVFVRRSLDGEDGRTFQITPTHPVDQLRQAIASEKPPVETGEFRQGDLVDLETLDPTIKLDIRYASNNNFIGTPLYTKARAFMQRPAALALLKVHKGLAKEGLGLLIHDAYRPWKVTKLFWDATPESGHGFVADPAKGSKHNRGCAVDLTLYDLKTKAPIEMTGGYDEFSARSHPFYPGGTSLQRFYRDKLRQTMEAEGFTVNKAEWWHFDYQDWNKYPILDLSFEDL